MKNIIEPVVDPVINYKDKQSKQPDCKSESVQRLGQLQKDRSFLPKAKDQPVHKCGC